MLGAPDERFGQRVVALVSPAHGATVDQEELAQFIRKNLASYKVPKQMIVVDHVQRAVNGKHDYKWARQIVEQAARSANTVNWNLYMKIDASVAAVVTGGASGLGAATARALATLVQRSRSLICRPRRAKLLLRR